MAIKIFLIVISVVIMPEWAFSQPHQMDQKAYHALPEFYEAIAASGIPKNKQGLIGRNATWGKMYSPRFQLGVGRSLRTALVVESKEHAQRAFLGIKAGVQNIQDDGYIPSNAPLEVLQGETLSEADIASGAAFFLGDTCAGMYVLENHPHKNEVGPVSERNEVVSALDRGVRWLQTQTHYLKKVDRAAPNRLLFDAYAFYGCGKLTDNAAIMNEAHNFVDAALILFSQDGYFIEGGGWDTSYQSVAIRLGNDLLAIGYEDGQLRQALLSASQWLGRHVDEQGRVNSKGNKRTCEGGESFIGKPKKIALGDTIAALVNTGIREHDNTLVEAGKRIFDWYQSHQGEDPCFSYN